MSLSKSQLCFALSAMFLSFSNSISAVQAAKPIVPWSSVRQIGRGRHQGVATTSFVQPDPSFSGATVNNQVVVNNIDSFTNTASQTISPSNLTGLNIPSFGRGLFPATGQLLTMGAFYSTPSTLASSADGSLYFVVQTADGLYHQASFTTEASTNQGTRNGRTNWTQFVGNRNSFSPPLGLEEAGRIRKEAIVFTGSPASGFDAVNQILPAAIADSTGGFYFIAGREDYITNNPLDLNSKADFSLNTHPDSRFNFEF